MEPSLLVIGLNHKTAPVEVRERFAISDGRLYDALHELSTAPGIAEVMILSTCNRTEFIMWASDWEAADTALVKLLTRDYGLRLCEWKHFYRYLTHEALVHIFRVAASLDSMVVGEPEICGQVKAAWAKAKKAGTTGRFLDAIFQKALGVSKRVRNETAIGASAVSVPYAAVELARQVFKTLEGRKVLILGAGKMSELSARYLVNSGASRLLVANRTFEHAQDLAARLGGEAIRYEDRWDHLGDVDILIASTGCPHFIFVREDAERVRSLQHDRPFLLLDISVPRNIDPAVREVPGVFLFNIDDLEDVVAQNLNGRKAAAAQGEKIVEAEARSFPRELAAIRLIPTLSAVRERLDEIGQQEVARYVHEFGLLDKQKSLEEIASRITQRITGLLGGELKRSPEEQGEMAAAVHRLFHLAQPDATIAAGASAGKTASKFEPAKIAH